MGAIRVACAQIAPVLGDLEGNLARAGAAIDAAVAQGAELVVLPELCLSGYALDPGSARAAAVASEALAAWSRPEVVVVGGFAELGEDGALYNSAAVVDATGVRAVYRKVHLWDREPALFAAGDEAPPVVPTAVGRVAAIVCFDLFFPEWVRVAALAGAEVLCVPGNWPAAAAPAPDRPQLLRAQVAAEANGIVVATCDRWGEERGERWAGATGVAAPDGSLVAAAPGAGEALVVADVSLAARPSFLAARRPELYGPVCDAGELRL